MMNTVRHTFHSIGDRGGDFARTIGHGSVDLARRFGDGTSGLARRIGPRRALIGLAVAAVAIGGSLLVIRYLRSRRVQDGVGLEREDMAAAGPTSRSSDLAHAPGSDVHARH